MNINVLIPVKLFLLAFLLVLCNSTITSSQADMVCDIPPEGFAIICDTPAYFTVTPNGSEIASCGTMLNGAPVTFDCESSAFDPGSMTLYVWRGGDLLAIDTSLPCGSNNVSVIANNVIPNGPSLGSTLGFINGDPVLYALDASSPSVLFEIDVVTGLVLSSTTLMDCNGLGISMIDNIAFDPRSGRLFAVTDNIDNIIFEITPGNNCINACFGTLAQSGGFDSDGFSIGPNGEVYFEGDLNDDFGTRAIYSYQLPDAPCFSPGAVIPPPTIVATYSMTVGELNTVAFNGTACLQSCADRSCEITDITLASCIDLADGSATANLIGGIAPFDYIWDNGETTQTAVMLLPGVHSVTITDAANCEIVCDDFIVGNLPELICEITETQPILCFGESNGALSVEITGGTAPFEILWSNGLTTPTIENLPPGNYFAEITDANGCFTVCEFDLIAPPLLLCGAVNLSDVSCFGFSDGSATVNPSGGTPPYSFLWSSGESTQVAVALSVGLNTVTVTDANGCDVTCDVGINQPLEFTCTAELIQNTECAGEINGSAEAVPNNGIAPFTYLWDNGETTAIAVMLASGQRSVTITDSNGCEAICSVDILEQTDIVCVLELIQNVSCTEFVDGSAIANVTGGVPPFSFAWSNGETTQTAVNLMAGIATLTITDSNGCDTTCEIEITEPPLLECSVTVVTDVACFGESTGEAIVSVSGGTAPFTILWDDGQTVANPVGLDAGLSIVTITDANGCITNCFAEILSAPELLCDVALINNVNCNGFDDGSATAIPSGGTPPFTFIWSNTETTQTAEFLEAGLQVVVITDANGCEVECSILITEPEELTCSVILINDVICQGEFNGSAQVVPAGGTTPFTFLWDNGETTQTASMLSAGPHLVTVTDANLCETTCSVTIGDQSQLSCSITLENPILCGGDATGALSVNPEGGLMPFSFLWSNGETTQTIMDLVADTYTVTVTDSNGCTTECSFMLTEPPVLDCTISLVQEIACFGDENGSATITPTGGTPGFTFLWDNGETTATAVMLSGGPHSATVTDANNCTTVCMIVIPGPEELLCTVNLVSNITCFGDSDGSATVVVTGGTPGFSFAWSNGETTATATMLVPGLNIVTVTDMNGCTTSCSVDIIEPLELTCTVSLINDVFCAGESTGSATAIPTNGVTPFSFLWDNGESTATATMLASGPHTVTVTDSDGCLTTCSIVINEPLPLVCDITLINNVTCHLGADGSASVAAMGGTAPFTFAWSNGESGPLAEMLQAGLNTVTITDANNCMSTCTIMITEPPIFECSTSVINGVLCAGDTNGSALVTATGGNLGFTFLWDNGETTATAVMLSDGFHTVTVTDALGCEIVCDIIIPSPPPLICNTVLVSDITCFGANDGSATVEVIGGTPDFTFLWNTGETSATAVSLVPGLNTVTVTDANNCTTTCDILISEPLEFLCEAVLVSNVLCAGDTNGSATVSPTNGIAPFTYLWDNGETTATAVMLSGGSHTVTVTDATNCTTECEVEIMDQSTLECAITLVQNVSCNGGMDGSATAVGIGGSPPFSFAWDNGETTATAVMLDAGIHTVTVNDMNNCGTTCTIEITEPPLLECMVTLENDISCFGFNDGSATVSAIGGTPGFSYLWDDGQTTATAVGLLPGTRMVTVTDANNCETVCDIFIEEPPELTCSITLENDISCFGADDGSATVVPVGGRPGFTFFWDDGQITATAVGLTPGLHSVTVTDMSGCTTDCEITIQEPLEFTCTVDLVSNVLCAGDTNGSATAVPSNGIAPFTYLWDNGETTATAVMLSGGSHTVTITDATNCTTSCDIDIMDQSTLECDVTLVQNVSCNGGADGSATATGMGGSPPFNFTWDNGETTATAVMLDAGIHTVTVNDMNNCGTTCTIEITEPPLLECMVTLENDVSCFGFDDGSATVSATGGTPGFSYLWDDGQTTATAVGLLPGTRMVTVTDANNCETICDIFIEEPPELTCSITLINDISCFGANDGSATAEPVGGRPGYTYLWDDGQTTQTVTGLLPGIRTVTVTDISGCTTECEITIQEPLEFTCTVDLVNNVLCAGDTNGSATAVPSNGIAPFTFLWDNGETTATAVMLTGGSHTVTITDATNCTTICDIEIMDQSTLECDVTLVQNVSCNGGVDGSATATGMGGSPPFNFTWDNGETTATAVMLNAGIHTVTVNDMNNCGTTCTIEITEPPLLECMVTLENDISCFGFDDGSATVSATGGTPGFSYLWDDGQTTATAVGLLPGTRMVTVTDANNCETICDIFIEEPPELTCSVTLENDISCFGANDGSATVVPVGGRPGFTFLWDDGQITATAVGLTPGLHSVTVTDMSGCTTECEITIQEPLEFTCTVDLVNNVLCAGDTNGSATAVPSNGIAPFTFLWDNGEITATAVMLTGGSHTVTITDATNCTTTCDIEIMDQSTLECDVTLVQNVSCNGGVDGSATATGMGGSPPFNFTWDNGETTATAVMLNAGIHTVTVNDMNNCGTTCTIEITEPPLLECMVTLENDISCFGFNDGSATVSATGGTPGFSFLWDDGQTTATAIGLLPGTRMVTVTDANNCETICDIFIEEPPELICSITLENDISCFGANDGSATVVPMGGRPGFTFLWDDGQITATAVGLTPGLHSVTVTDMSGCTTECEITIQEPLEFTCTVDLVNNVLCAGDTNGSATAVPSNGIAPFTFLWDNGEVTATAVLLTGGSHTVTITDATNCTTECDIEIMDQSTLECDVTLVQNVSCNGGADGSATATGMGGSPPFNFTWDNGETTATAVMLDAGIHTVTVNDMNNCGTTCTIEITEPPLLECMVTLENDISCFGFNDGSATVSATGGTPSFSFLWDDGQTTATATGLLPGTRMVTVTDANNCETICDIFIEEPPELTCSITLVNNISCFGANDGSATVDPMGGRPDFTFLWDDGQITATAVGLTPGLHSVTVTDMSGCTTECEITIQEPLEFTCTVDLINDVLCAGDTNGSATAVTSNGIAPFTFLWDNGETTTTAVMLTGGTNTVTITDSNGCQTECSIFIQDQSGLTCEITVENDITCFGFNDGSATGMATGGVPPFTYAWDNGETTQTAIALGPGTHELTVTDNNNCGTICLVDIFEPTIISLVEPISTFTITCSGNDDGSAGVVVTGGTPDYTFLWSNGETTQEAIALPEGPGSVTITDANGCELIEEFIIDPPEFPTVEIINVAPVSCESFFAGTENDGTATADAFGGVPGYTYLWSNGETTQTATALMPGINSVTVTDQFGCEAVQTVEIILDNCFSIDLDKIGVLANPDELVTVGSEILYSFEVCNTGTVTLNIVTISDELVTVTGGPVNLLPGQCDATTFIGIYEVTQADIDNQFVTNTALAQGFDVINNNPVISSSDNPATAAIDDPTTIILQQPSISLDKQAVITEVQSPPQPGDLITYIFTVCNVGDVPLTSVTVTDPLIELIGNPIPVLNPGVCDDITYSGTYEITATDIAIGFFENTALVSSFDGNGNIVNDRSDDPMDLENEDPNGDGNPDDPTVVPLQAFPAVELFKVGEVSECPTVGDLIIYSFNICNTGNVDLANLAVTDDLATVIGSPIALAPGDCNAAAYMASYVITQNDIDNGIVINSALVTGNDANNNPVSDISDDPFQASDSDTEGDGEPDDATFTFLIQKPSIILEKVGEFNDESGDGIAQVGETVSYTFVVRNTGNVTLTNVIVTDPLVTVLGGPISTLGVEVEDSLTFTGNYTLQSQDIDIAMVENTAQVSAFDPIGQTVTNTATELVEYVVRSCDEIICNNDLQVSLGPSCELFLNEDQLIEDPVFGNYTISIFDGDSLLNDVGLLNEESIGRTLMFQVFCGLNSCWGSLTVEGNSFPEFDSPCSLGPNGEINPECSFLCNEFGIPLDLITVEEVIEIFASPCTPDLVGTINVTETREGDECTIGGVIVTVIYSGKFITHGVISEEQEVLTQAYTIDPLNSNDVLFPFDVTVDCNISTSPETLAGVFQNSRFGFPTIFDENFVPEGDSILVCDPGGLEEIILGTREVMNLEIIDGQEVWTLVTIVEKQTIVVVDSSTCRIELDPESIEGLNFVPIDGRYCNLLSSFSDVEFPACGNTMTILREWTIIDWCDVNITVSGVQTIETVDNSPPQRFRFLSDVFVNIAPWECTGSFVLPSFFPGSDFFESCSDPVDVEYFAEEGVIVDNVLTELRLTNDPILVRVTLTDACGNQTTDSFRIITQDLTVPVVICNPDIQVFLTGTEDNGSGTLFAADLDEGSHDAGCGIVDLQIIRVQDNTNPVFACDGSLLGFEPVTCGPETQMVFAANEQGTEKEPNCTNTDSTLVSVAGDFVKFCCADVGQSIEVILIATDKQGNSNQCVVEVTVRERIVPQLSCPTIVTDCRDDEITLPEIVGSICAIEEFEPILVSELEDGSSCANATMIREWFIDIDGNGIVDPLEPFCTQIVTIDGDIATLDPLTIRWPISFDGSIVEGINIECDEDGNPVEGLANVAMGEPMECIAEGDLDEPVWCTTDCSLVGSSVEVDTIASSEACFSIIRRWTVVDWCTFNANGSNQDQDQDSFVAVEDWAQFECTDCFFSGPTNSTNYLRYDQFDMDGFYTYDQVIQVIDRTGPEIFAPSEFVVVVGTGNEVKVDSISCLSSEIIEVSGSDACNGESINSEDVRWTIVVQKDGEEIATKNTTGPTATMSTQAGQVGDEHRIIWIANDNCGNESTFITTVNFVDDVLPNPFCLTGLTSTIPDDQNSVKVWANEFDFGSFDNCTSDDELRYSIVPADTEPIRPDEEGFDTQAGFTLSCDDQVTVVELDMWVWDLNNNGDFCTVEFRVNENCDIAAFRENVTIAGRIRTEGLNPIPAASISLNATLPEFPRTTLSNDDGQYSFASNPIQEDYEIVVGRDGDDIDGLSTVDLLMIQRHIVGIQSLDNPFAIIASDANNDSQVSASDIVTMRRLILGLDSEFSNTPSWRFIDQSASIFDTANPWPFTETIAIQDILFSGFEFDFVGVKIGDINQDGTLFANEIRSTEKERLVVDEVVYNALQEIEIPVYAEDLSAIYGVQFTLEHEGLQLVDILPGQLNISEGHYAAFDGYANISWNSQGEEVVLSSELPMFILKFETNTKGRLSETLQLSSASTKAEVYTTTNGIDAIDLSVIKSTFAVYQNEPNPFSVNTTISFDLPETSEVRISYYNASGQLLRKMTNEFTKGRNEITISKAELNHTGLIYYKLESDFGTEMRKMILLD